MKISVTQSDTERRLLLEGALVGAGLEELRTMGHRLRAGLDGRTLVIDIKDAAVVSQEGENVLLRFINEGARVCARSVIVRRVLQEVARRSKKEWWEIDATASNEGPSCSSFTSSEAVIEKGQGA